MSKVYRATNLPEHVDRLGALELLAECIPGITLDDIQLGSLTFAIDPWALTPTKTATLTLRTVPIAINEDPTSTEWVFPAAGLVRPIILDTHFYGLTPLNEVEESSHTDDCIVISGLASHPMGSWQPRGERSFMWIRDLLPARVPGVRFILYGYDTRLSDSKSFQVIPDLALSLINELRAGGWGSQSPKPLLFLAHSLGGVLLKQAMVMLAGSGEIERKIISGIKGGVFFGVPSVGMEVSDMYQMLGEQPNRALVDNLSNQSSYIPELEKQFEGISYVRDMVLNWAFETQQTPSLVHSDGRWSRSGPGSVMVSPESATGGRYPFHNGCALQINQNHSNMVKFRANDREIPILTSKIQEISQNSRLGEKRKNITAQPPSRLFGAKEQDLSSSGLVTDTRADALVNLIDDVSWFSKVLLESFAAPERNHRLEQIDENAEHTFDWVFDDPSIGLASWLLKGEGIFWISGKPGSGKSTMLKFVWNDDRFKQLLDSWEAGQNKVIANFFFHHRGSLAQKSFEGLLRSVLSQILEARPGFCVFFKEIVENAFPKLVARWRRYEEEKKTSLQDPDRDDIDFRIPRELWTQRLLKDCLKAVMLQNKMDIDIFLLFDALDEYDGPPEFIADFLKQLVNTTSRTRVRVLFSSRPWKVFQDEFSSCPGFAIHNYTENDIRQYLLSFITPATAGEEALLGLTEDIVRRSQGVFLWVKLVLQELTLVVTMSSQNNIDNSTLRPQLHDKLRKLPDQLDQFYDAIVERLPDVYRWETYVLLESLVRSRGIITTIEAVEILALSRAATAKEATRIFEKEIKEDLDVKEQRIQNIKAISGGLIEVLDDGGYLYLQLMHQTVYEFVERLRFRHSILGLRGKTTIRNGHSFLAVWFFYQNVLRIQKLADKSRIPLSHQEETELAFHAQEAERTTGISQHYLLASRTVMLGWPLLMFGVAIGLRLLVRDILREDPGAIVQCDGALLSAMIKSLERGFCKPIESTQMASILVEHGYRIEKDWDGILHLFDRIWQKRSKAIPDAKSSSISPNTEREAMDWESYIALAWEALRGLGDDTDLGRICNNPPSNKSPLLHRSPPEMVSKLLESGADPNIIDPTGSTALDTFLDSLYLMSPKAPQEFRINLPVYEAFESLITHGAMLRKRQEFPWDSLVSDFEKSSYPVDFIQDYGFPRWLKDSQEDTPRYEATPTQEAISTHEIISTYEDARPQGGVLFPREDVPTHKVISTYGDARPQGGIIFPREDVPTHKVIPSREPSSTKRLRKVFGKLKNLIFNSSQKRE